MTLQDVARALRERWRTIAVAVLLALVLGVLAFAFRPTTYTSTVTFAASPRTAALGPQDAYQASLLAKGRVPSYVQLATSPQVLSDVIARSGLKATPDGLLKQVTATNTPDSTLIEVAVASSSAGEASRTAAAFADVLPAQVDQLEQAGAPAPGGGLVVVRAIRPLLPPQTPAAPGLPLTLAIALLAGLVVGTTVALVRDALDRSVRTADDLGVAAGAPVLAGLPRGSGRSTAPALVDPRSAAAEAYRRLRTALHGGRHAAPGVVAVTSPGSREGRTTVVGNLGVAAAAAGLSVVVVDADLRRPQVAGTLGVPSDAGLTDVLAGHTRFDRAVRGCSSGFDVLPTGPLPSNPSELLTSTALEELFDALHARYDLVLVDTPPVLPVTDAAVVAGAADAVLLLARHGRTRRPDLAAAAATLAAADAHVLGTVLTAEPQRGPTLLVSGDVRSPIRPRPAVRGERPDRPERGVPAPLDERATRAEPAAPAVPGAPAGQPGRTGAGRPPLRAVENPEPSRPTEPPVPPVPPVPPARTAMTGLPPTASPTVAPPRAPSSPAAPAVPPGRGGTPNGTGNAPRGAAPATATGAPWGGTALTGRVPGGPTGAGTTGTNGHGTNGNGTNGHGTNGRSPVVPATTGRGTNGHGTNGHGTNGAAANGAAVNGASVNGASVNGSSANGASPNGSAPTGGRRHRRAADDSGALPAAEPAPSLGSVVSYGGGSRHGRRDPDAEPPSRRGR